MKLLLHSNTTERLLFRKLLPSDFGTWLPFHQDPRTSEFWKGLPQEPKSACQQQFNRVFERYEKELGGMNAILLKTTGAMVGLCGLMVQTADGTQELEVGYSVLPHHWLKGYATEA